MSDRARANASLPSDGELTTVYIDIGRDFSAVLGVREDKVGPFSGEKFLNDVLRPAYLTYERVVISLDSIKNYGASFFEEAFGGLVREFGLAAVEKKIRFVAVGRAHLVPLIQSWMRQAESNRPRR